jgi:uncharacterized membrane protein
MDANLNEWLHLLVRWFHVFAGILWIGQTYFFSWLDARLNEVTEGNPSGQAWMVHSGGFYLVGRQKIPQALPQKLHWFKWEAAFTWLSGMVLLILVYDMGGLMVDEGVSSISVGGAIALGLGLLPVSWVVYDLLWTSPLERAPRIGAAISFFLILATAFGLSHVLSGRAAYIHVGAILGTLMAANVWLRILPAQKQLVAAIQAGKAPDGALAARAKGRSKHNTYMVLPLVLIMISNHFPTATYGHDHSWAILGLMVLLGWGAAKLLRG